MMIVHELIEDMQEGTLHPTATIYLELDGRGRPIDWWRPADTSKSETMLEMTVSEAIEYCMNEGKKAILDNILDINEACDEFGFTRPTLRRLCSQGKFGTSAKRIGRDWLIIRDALEAHCKRKRATQLDKKK